MGVKFKGNDPEDLIRALQARKVEVVVEAAQIVSETVREAQKVQREFLDKATTSYGEFRFSQGRGRSAGRNDSGTMMDAIGWDVEKSAKYKITGRWGWLNGILDYFIYQEKGIGVPEAHSLVDSYIVIRERFRARMKGLFRG